jgi:hypothetical protein
MNNWFSHAHLIRLESGMRDYGANSKLLQCPIDDVRLGDGSLINLKDRATELLFKVVKFDPYQRFTDLTDFKKEFRVWAVSHSLGPGTYKDSWLEELYSLKQSPGGWDQLDQLVFGLIGTSFSQVVEDLRVFHPSDDPGLHGNECLSVSLQVVSHELTNSFSVIPWKAMASTLDLVLPFVDDVVAAQSLQHWNLVALGSKSDYPSYSERVARARPSEITVSHNGRSVLVVPIPKVENGQPFQPDWAKTRFFSKSRATIESVIAVAPASAANLLKGRLLEDELGL